MAGKPSYDVVIVGASFAGLAVANQLRDHRVLLIDRKPVGTGQTSACGTMLRVLQYWDATEAVLQTHDNLVLHTARRTMVFPSPYPWCIFDYGRLCDTLFERSGADFLQVAAQGYDGEQVRTKEGTFRARCVVDASGWRAALASSLVPGFAPATLNLGIETIRPLPGDAAVDPLALHFWYDPAILQGGVGWLFPRGDTAGIGVGSYYGTTSRLRRPLERFAARFDVQPDGLHGTRFPCSLRAPTAGAVFVVGDAAGMCLGLTGEGIRPALFFGEACGRIVRRVLEDELPLEAGLAEYAAFVAARRLFFRFFSLAQAILLRVPTPWVDGIARLVRHDRLRPWVLDRYWDLTREWDSLAA